MAEKLYLQNVIVHKTMPFEDAKKKALEIMGKKKAHVTEFKETWHFRNIPKTRFKPESFRAKKVNESITLTLGHLA